ncbi:glycoside hydrolase domain-containing protein [candidate division KSB1 bacterium]
MKTAVVVLFAAAVMSCAAPVPPFRLALESSMVKVFFDQPFGSPQVDLQQISAAAGEYESFQVVIHGLTEDISGVRAEAGDFKGKPGRIKSEHITINPVGYIETTVESKYYTSALGWWPDPLLEMNEFDLKSGEVQPFWVTVHVPPGTPAGEYSGRIKVSVDRYRTAEIDVSLLVRDFEIPVRPSLKTLTWMKPLGSFYGCERGSDDEIAIHKRYYDMLLKHRLGPGGNVELEDDILAYCMDRGMNSFLLEIIPNLKRQKKNEYSAEYKTGLKTKLADCVERFGPVGWLDGTAYVYNYDEVDRDHWPLAKEMYRLVKSVSPQLKVIQCLNIPEGVRALAGYADTWDVYFAQYAKTGVEQRRLEGDEVWLAVCCYPSVRPNLFHEYPAIDARMLGWLCWLAGVSGFEYWSPNHWNKNDSTPGLRGGWIANTFSNYNGDGYLLYPGENGRPLASQRLANLRDGFEDYEYLNLLEKLTGEADIPSEVATTTTDYSDDPAAVYRARADIARRIEALLAEAG